MPDTPDWQKYLPGSDRYALSDLGELAARLGSPLRFDRRGEVFWYDQFDHGLNPYKTVTIGSGAAVAASTSETFMSKQAALLTAGSDSAKLAEIGKSLQPASLGRWGVELAIAFLDEPDYFEFHFTINDGETQHQPAFRLSATDDEIQYKNSSQTYTSLATLGGILTTPETYRICKLVFDLTTSKYVYFKYGPVEYDLSDIDFYTQASTNAAQYFIRGRLIGNSGDNDKVQIGHVIITDNEP